MTTITTPRTSSDRDDDDRQRNIELEGQIDAIRKSQAVIEFDLDGTIIYANDTFLDPMG